MNEDEILYGESVPEGNFLDPKLELGKKIDRLMDLESELGKIDESNWREIFSRLGETGLDAAETMEMCPNPSERLKCRKLVTDYKIEIRACVRDAMKNGDIDASEEEAKVEEIFGRTIMTEIKL